MPRASVKGVIKPHITKAVGEVGDALLWALNETALVSLTDDKGNILYANDKFVNISKYSRDELIGQNHRILKSGKQPNSLFNNLWTTISSGQTWRGEILNKAKDDSYYWVDTSIAPILNKRGKPVNYISVRFLITDKKHASERLLLKNIELKAEKIQSDALLKGIGEGIIVINKSGRISNVNPIACEILEVNAAKLIGANIRDVFVLYDKNSHKVEFKNRPTGIAMRTGKVYSSSEFMFKTKSGLKPLSTTASVYKVNSKISGVVVVFRDITSEKIIENTKTEFVSLASHQLRTPLSAINWYTEMLIAGDAGSLSDTQIHYLEEIENSNKRLISLVNDLLNISRLELGTFKVEPEKTNIIDLAKEIILTSEPQIFKRKLNFEEEYDEKLPLLMLDPKLTTIIIENLVSNAIKYTPVGGSIKLKIIKENNNVLIKVTDSGFGIPSSQKELIFSKLFRADNIKSESTEGTGLGLYIIKSILDYIGGSIYFRSIENKGTTFNVLIPLVGMEQKSGV